VTEVPLPAVPTCPEEVSPPAPPGPDPELVVPEVVAPELELEELLDPLATHMFSEQI
jgi:hypothetical protein